MQTRQGMQSISTCVKMFWELWNKIFLNIFLFWTREHSPFYHLHSWGIETCIAHLSYACNSKQIAAAKPFSMAVIFHFTDREKALCETFFGNPHFLPSCLFRYENFMRWFLLCTEGPHPWMPKLHLFLMGCTKKSNCTKPSQVSSFSVRGFGPIPWFT